MSSPRTKRTALHTLVVALIVLAGFALAGIGGPYFGKISEVSTNSSTDFLPETAESTQVAQLLPQFLGEDQVPAIVVLASENQLTESERVYLDELPQNLTESGIVEGEASPIIYSEDGKAAELIIALNSSGDTKEEVKEIRGYLANAPDTLATHVTGPAGFAADLSAAFGGIDGILLAVALIVVFIILLIVYRSPFLPILVLLSSMVALSGSIFVIWHMADAGIVKINGQVQGILLILVVGAATDYSILYVSRFREALTRTSNRFEATQQAWRGSFEPILASGGTVIAGLLCLLFSELASNKALGPVAATGIALSMLVSLTFLPALLALTGRIAFWPARPQLSDTEIEQDSKFWAKIADFVSAKPRAVWAATAAALLICAGFSATLNADGVRQSDLVLGASDARDGQALLAQHFPGGSGSPARVVVPQADQERAVTEIEATGGVDSISLVSQDSPSGSIPVGTSAGELPPMFADLSPTVVNGQIMLNVTLENPADSPEAEVTVTDLRSSLESAGISALVGGESASDLDTINSATRDRALIIPLVLAVITIILMLLLRSVIAPLILVVATVISYLSALGVSAIFFNHVFNFPGADPTVPLYGFVFLVALGIDYTIFLMTRVREETLSIGTKAGMRKALIVTGGVITSAGIVLAATFSALAVIPLIFLVQLAFMVAFGVILDATVVRALLIPALVEDIGSKIWWPSKLTAKK